VAFCLFGFIIVSWADSFEQLHVIPLLVVCPRTFLGCACYSFQMLPPFCRTVTLINPVVYLIISSTSTYCWNRDFGIELSLLAIGIFLSACIGVILWMFRTGYRLKS